MQTVITAHKRSLGQGNIFRSVCQEFCPQGGCLLGGVPGGDPPGTATAAGGTHPTGMHSCLEMQIKQRYIGEKYGTVPYPNHRVVKFGID